MQSLRNAHGIPQTSRAQHVALVHVLLPLVLLAWLNGFYLPPLARANLVMFWIVDLAYWIVLPLGALLYLQRQGIRAPMYGLRWPADWTWKRGVAWTLAIFVVAQPLFGYVRYSVWLALGRPFPIFSWGLVFPQDGTWHVIGIWYAALSAGIVESLVYIGLPWLLYSGMRRAPSRLGFTIASTLAFAVAHWEQGLHLMAAACVMQLVFCAAYFYFRTLWPVIAAHTLMDLAAFS